MTSEGMGVAMIDRPSRTLCPLAMQVRASRDPIIGRSVELAAFRQEAATAKAGSLACVGLEGEPGIGKTRLLMAAQELVEAEGFTVAAVAADEELRGPFLLARSIFGCRSVQELAAATGAEQAVARALDATMGREDPGLAGLPADEKLLRTYDQAAIAVSALCAAKPLALLLDDLQWADPDSLRLLRYVVRSEASSPILLVMSMRPEETAAVDELVTLIADMERLGLVRRLRVQRFSVAETTEFLHQVLGGEVQALSGATIQGQAEGVPFIVEELAKAYREAGMLRQVDGRWTLTGNAGRLMPSAVRTLIARRAMRLSESTRGLLAVAGILGRSFSLRDLGAVTERLDEQELQELDPAETLAPAISAGLIVAYPEGSAADYGFSHEQVREFLVSSLSTTKRRRIHALIVDLLAGGGDPSPESLAALAHHARAAGDAEASARFSIEAAREALGRNAPEEVLRSIELGLPVVSDPRERVTMLMLRDDALGMLRRPEPRLENLAELSALADALDDAELSLRLALRRAAALRDSGDEEAAAQVARDVRRRAQAMGNARLELDASLELGQALLRSALGEALVPVIGEIDAPGAREAFERALELATELEDESGMAAANRELGVVGMAEVRAAVIDMIASGEIPRNLLEYPPLATPFMAAVDHFQRAIEAYDRLGDRHGLMSSILGLAYASWGSDFKFSGAVRRLEEIRRLSDHVSSLATESERAAAELHLLYGVHSYAREFGDPDLSLSRGEQAYRMARAHGDRMVEFLAAGGMALALLQVGDATGAAEWLERAAGSAAEAPTPLKARQLAAWRGRWAAATGDAAQMLDRLERAVELAAEQNRPAGRCEALSRLAVEAARLGSERGDEELLAVADEAAQRALELAAGLPGRPPWRARANAALTYIRAARPDRGDALETARAALDDLRASEQNELFLDIRLPCARAVLAGGGEDEVAGLRAELQQLLGAVAEHTLDPAVVERWFATPPQSELVDIAGGVEAAREAFRSSPLVVAYGSLPAGDVDLSSEERELLRLMSEAMPDSEIAQTLGLSEDQVKQGLAQVMARLNAPSRAAATTFVFLQRLV